MCTILSSNLDNTRRRGEAQRDGRAHAVLQTPSFCGNVRKSGYRDNRGRLGVNVNDTVKLADLDNSQFGTRIWDISPIQAES